MCYSNNDTLTAAGVTINGSASVTFVAGHTVHLTTSFRATAGTAPTTFHTWVETVPSVISFSPSGSSGLTQAFTFTVSSPSGFSNLSEVFALFNTAASGANACYIRYNRVSNLLYLADDSGANWSAGFTPGTSGSAGNSYCSINGIGASYSASGNQLSVTVPVTFQASFSGLKNEYLIAYDQSGLRSGWQTMGTWTVPASQQYSLTTAVNPQGGGTVSLSPAGGVYPSGTQVQVTATPSSGYQFTSFTGLDSINGSVGYVTMNANRSVTANFTQATFTQTITTSPVTGLTLSVDGAPCTAPCTFQWAPATNHTISASATQSGEAGTQYTFSNWSDGGAISHTITTPSSPATYTASFVTQHYLTTTASPPTGGTISPPSGWHNSGTVVSVAATANTGYQFTGFSGNLSGTTMPQNLTMTGPAAVTASFQALQPGYSDFLACINDLNQSTCLISGGPYLVGAPGFPMVSVARSNLTIGSVTGEQVILRRSPGYTGPIISVFNRYQILNGVTIRKLTIDGNRSQISCETCNDLEMINVACAGCSAGFSVKITDSTLTNAPGYATIFGWDGSFYANDIVFDTVLFYGSSYGVRAEDHATMVVALHCDNSPGMCVR